MVGYLLILLSEYHGEAFNIGTETPEISMKDLAEFVIRVSKRPLKVITKQSDDSAYLTDNPMRRCPSIKKARELLGYEPLIGIEEGLLKTYAYYMDNPSASDA
jgi:dTDP-glucose 4,6-dehydratase/UDP-glucuronate decarboxylase